jgi:GT2 family glycosyltransferase
LIKVIHHQNLMETCTLAVLITCYNRKQNTLSCLAALLNQQLPTIVSLTVYLVDDGSTDGTATVVQQEYPQVKILQGNGQLFWSGGMRLAFTEAMQQDYDFYLWLNDDTVLNPDAVNRLLSTIALLQEQETKPAIVAGSTYDAKSGARTYGGVRAGKWWHPIQFQPIEPGTAPQQCYTMNGNCVLISRSVVQRVGNLDPTFHHYLGDYDYGLRARKHGCSVWLAPGFVGTCAANPAYECQVYSKVTRKQIKQLTQPKGLSLGGVILYSFQEWFVFTKRYGGTFWLVFWLLPYRRLIRLLALGR